MNPTLIFLDIDGTLTEPGSNTPPASALEAVRRAQARGHKVALCSGRNYGMLSPLLQYGFDAVISSAGGYIEYEGKVIYNCPMSAQQQKNAMEIFEQNGVFRTVESRDGSYTDEGFKQFLAKASGSNSEQLRWREQLEKNLGIRPMTEYQGEPIYKIVFMSPGMDALQKPMELLGAEFDFCIQEADQNGIINGELINKQFNKGTAVRRLCEASGIALADTVAFGDSMNDLEMLQTAGLSICMGNGSEALKKIADEVCLPVDQDGLFHAFEAHGLI